MSTSPTLSNAARALRGMPDTARVTSRAIALVVAVAPAASAAYLAISLLSSLLPVVQAWLAKLVVDEVAGGAPGGPGRAVGLGVLYVGTLVVPAALDALRLALAASLEDYTVAEVDRRLMDAGARLPDLYRVERPAFGDEQRKLDEVPYWLPRLLPALQNGLGTSVTLGGLLLLLGGLHPLLPLAIVLVAVPHLVVEHRLHDLQYRVMIERSRVAREMDYCMQVATEPEAAKEVRVFGLGGFFLARFRERFEDALREITRLRLAQLRVSVLFSGLYALALGGGFWYVAREAGRGRLSVGDLALYLNAVIQAQTLSFRLRLYWGLAHEATLHLRGFFSFLDSAAPAIRLPLPAHARSTPATKAWEVELRGVSFQYPEGEEPVLRDVDLTLEAGKVTALVGANGAGKSTLVKLLTRMYDPTGGEVLLDCAPLHEYDLDDLRSRIAVAYQDFARFPLTLRENIAVGASVPGEADGRVEEAARLSGADAVSERLERGYDTELTRRFEGGVELSGGEWQKVALARSFVRDASLVILDEPTAALDADAEFQLFGHFRELAAGRTALIISHRFSTVRMADRIIVLEDGRIAESGSHAELLELGGRYAELFEMQAGRYR